MICRASQRRVSRNENHFTDAGKMVGRASQRRVSRNRLKQTEKRTRQVSRLAEARE